MLIAHPDVGQRNVVVDVSERGLALEIDGRSEAAPWAAVMEVSAGKALLDRSSGVWILVLAIAIELGDEERLFIVGKVEPAWLALTAVLPTTLPGIAPFDQWGAALVAASEPLQLYRRAEDRT